MGNTDHTCPPGTAGSRSNRRHNARVRPVPRFLWAWAGVPVVVSSLSGCQESLTQVDSRLVAPATRPALDIASPLPRLGDIVSVTAPGNGGAAVTRWEASWGYGAAEGRQLREQIYQAADSLALEFDPDAARSVVQSVRIALTEIQTVSGSLPRHLAVQVSEAKRLLTGAERADGDGDETGSVLDALRAADALRETTPRMVAFTLVETAETALDSVASADGAKADSPDQERARRLTRWARTAIEAGDHPRAIQRAYYACRLLGALLP